MAISTMRHWESMGGAVPAHNSRTGPVNLNAEAQLQWYAIQTRHQFEKRTDSQLQRKGVETFLPLLRQVHRWSDRRKMVEVPLFPGYDFVHIRLDAEVRTRVLQTAGVIGFVGPPHGPTSIPPSQLEALRLLLQAQPPCALRPFLRTGQRVRIRNGSLDGVEGILQSTDRRSLVISIDCIEQSVAVTIEGYDLEVL